MGRCTLKQHSVDASIVLCNPFSQSLPGQCDVLLHMACSRRDAPSGMGWDGMGCWHVAVQLLAAPIMLFIIIFQFNTVPLCVRVCVDSFSMFTCANIL